MGEAKRRGSYKQRKAEGEARRLADARQREKSFAEKRANMTPEERRAAMKVQMMLLGLMGFQR